eukprot:5174106-Pyramimonas_sp.AAC.1
MIWRGEMPHDLMAEVDSVATNAFPKGQRGQATFLFDDRKRPRQVDFMPVHRDWLRKTHWPGTFSDATESDHLPLLLHAAQ